MLWVLFIVASAIAVLFVAWGFRRPGKRDTDLGDELRLNRDLYLDKKAELAQLLASGDLSHSQHDALLLEHQRQLLEDNDVAEVHGASGGRERWLLVALMVAVPMMAGGFYWLLGAADELQIKALTDQRRELLSSEQLDRQRLAELDARLIRQLQILSDRYTDKPVYPLLLARLYQESGNHGMAANYYRTVSRLLPEDGALQAEYAQSLFFANGNRMTDQIRALAEAAQVLNPGDHTALGLLGIAAFQEERFAEAIGYWQQALQTLGPLSPSRTALAAGIDAARERLGKDGRTDPGVAGPSLSVNVSLAQGFEAPPETAVFVYARAWQGAPMPLAIARLKLVDLPTRVTLDETMAMSPTMTIASVDQVELVARVSFSGTARPESGDFQGSLGPITVADDPGELSLIIDNRLP